MLDTELVRSRRLCADRLAALDHPTAGNGNGARKRRTSCRVTVQIRWRVLFFGLVGVKSEMVAV